ncbi:hypothetical protein D6D10_07728 [Aureobasidium pullulans]|uniref:WD40 repeat-like protein n=1 Tax=Aureobasidium pullulans TaxID=5580 RepID=A0A4S9EHT8_AURPU|nr:hypothetical protein D6D10_07728 [Aureobasidium pullulans]
MATTSYDMSAKLQKPRVSRHGKQMHLNYECPHRLNITKVYPLQSPRGADIIISGYDDGLHILWRGGRPLSTASRTVTERVNDLSGTRTQHTEWNHPISIHKSPVTEDIPDKDKPRYEAEDEELDEDEPYPSFAQELKLSFGSPVLHLALPNIPQPSTTLQSRAQLPLLVKQRIVLAVACADASLRLITLPLTPPSASAKRNGRLGAQICDLSPSSSSSAMARDVALTWTNSSSLPAAEDQMDLDKPQQEASSANHEKLDLLVASSTSAHLETLTFYRIPIAFNDLTGGKIPNSVNPFHAVPLSSSSQCLRFSTAQYPSRQHSRLLIADVKGTLKIYDPFATKGRPSSRGTDASAEPGAWISAFNTAFQMPKGATSNYPGLAQRRKIVDVAWVSGAKAALVLLDRGEWGVWDIEAVTQKKMNTFAIQGFIGSADAAPSDLKNRSTQGLAPSTPNTRQQRQESLFGAPKPAAPATTSPRGGVCAVATAGSHGSLDDSVVLWYGSEAYHISSLASLWQRSLNSSGKDIGSLYGPGLSHIEGLDLSGEILNGITQFPTRSTALNLGALSQRDFAVTGEYRLVIIQSMRPQTPAKSLFTQATAGAGNGSSIFDQQLLDRGELDLGGMDRLLDGMGTRTNGFAPAVTKKRVGFAG